MLEAIKRKSINPDRWLDLLAVLLLFSMMTTATARLVATAWVKNLSVVHPITFFAILAGLALGYSRFPRWLAGFFGLLYGTFVVPWQMGLVLTEGVEWKERLLSMAGRLSLVLSQLYERKPVTDDIFFLYLMGIVFWVLAIFAGYNLVRTGNAWLVLLPSGVAALVIQIFDVNANTRAWYLGVYIFLGLLMLSRVTLVHWRKDWVLRRSHFPPDVALDFTRSMVIMTAVIVIIAWNLPSMSGTLPVIEDTYKTIGQPFFSMRDRFSYMFAALRSSIGLVSDYYSDQQGLGQGQPKSDQIIMTVEGPFNPYVGARFYWRARVYDEYRDGLWYNTLDGRRSIKPDQPALVINDSPERIEAEFAFTPMFAIVSLYAPPQPVWFSRPGQIQFAANDEQGASTGEIDMVGMRAEPYIRAGEVYTVRSRLSSVTELELRDSGVEYPEWVNERYLEVPDSTTERTRALAEQLTRGLDNPYDKAQAITRWLRSNIQYTEVIDPPPTDRDVVDWFLFDYKRGFCNYYATAEVILLRLAGVPARWAVGYAQGERQEVPVPTEDMLESPFREPEQALYLVRENDAHSWPEAYFSGIGWIEFEPTASQDPILRASGETGGSENPEDPGEDPDPSLGEQFEPTPLPDDGIDTVAPNSSSTSTLGRVIVTVLLLSAGLALIWLIAFSRRKQSTIMGFWVKIVGGDDQVVAQWQAEKMPLIEQIERTLALLFSGLSINAQNGYSQERSTRVLGLPIPAFLSRWAAYALLPTISRAFHEVNRILDRLDKTPEIQATPGERVGQLVKLVPEAQQPASELLNEYQTALYSQHQANPQKSRLAAGQLRQIGVRAWWRKQIQDLFAKLQN